jgi:hypothetical protein
LGLKPNASDGGHKPWEPEQIKAALDNLTGGLRQGFLLYLYTGQRGVDVVKIGWTTLTTTAFV